jgi:hypothetical protein
LRTDPSILRHSWARHYVSRWILKLALRSEAPLSTLRELCAQIKEATADRRASRGRVRQTVAKSWVETASSLAVPARAAARSGLPRRPHRRSRTIVTRWRSTPCARSSTTPSISAHHRPRCLRVLCRVGARFGTNMIPEATPLTCRRAPDRPSAAESLRAAGARDGTVCRFS